MPKIGFEPGSYGIRSEPLCQLFHCPEYSLGLALAPPKIFRQSPDTDL